MRKLYLLIGMLTSGVTSLFSQTSFTDNFDSYTSGAYLTQSSNKWKTWSNTQGGSDDIKISSTKAYSGSNALYFMSTSANGGPNDIVLPFGGQYSTGTFQMSLMMFVETAHKGYFNLQEQTTLGNGWSVDVNFDSLGGYNLVNTLSGVLAKGTYTQNQWFKVGFVVDLSTNTWNFQINDVTVSTFQNKYRQVASMDIFPTQSSSFYIDDVSYSYTPATPTALNASVTFIDKVSGSLSGQNVKPVVEIRNLGTNVITSAEVEVSYNSTVHSKTVSGLSLAAGGYTTVSLDDMFKLINGSNAMVATVKTINGIADDNSADNSKTILLNPIVPAPGKAVVAEEGTGTWCQWCPRGAVWMKNMDERYPGYFIGIAVHNNDPMKNANYDGGMKTRISGYPSMLVDRGDDIDPSGVETDFYDRITVVPKGSIRNGAQYNEATRELKVSLTTKFNTAVSGNYKLAFVLVEDSVTGTTSAYNQANTYSGGGKGEMGGFEKLPNPVPAAQMVYDHVGRIVYPNFNGLSNAFAATVSANDSFIHNFSVVIDSAWRVSKLKIVGLLIDPAGRIDNGSEVTLEEALANGYLSGTAVSGVVNYGKAELAVSVHPNPVQENLNILVSEYATGTVTVSIYSADGRVIEKVQQNSGNFTIESASWAPGFYLVDVASENGSTRVRILKN